MVCVAGKGFARCCGWNPGGGNRIGPAHIVRGAKAVLSGAMAVATGAAAMRGTAAATGVALAVMQATPDGRPWGCKGAFKQGAWKQGAWRQGAWKQGA